MAVKISVAGLAMVCSVFKTPTGEAGICRQMQLPVKDGRVHPWGRVAIGTDEPVVCAYPEDLADRLGIPFCDEFNTKAP